MAEFFDRFPLCFIYLHEFKAVMKAAPVADFCADSQCGSKLDVNDCSGRKVLRENGVKAAFTYDEKAASKAGSTASGVPPPPAGDGLLGIGESDVRSYGGAYLVRRWAVRSRKSMAAWLLDSA